MSILPNSNLSFNLARPSKVAMKAEKRPTVPWKPQKNSRETTGLKCEFSGPPKNTGAIAGGHPPNFACSELRRLADLLEVPTQHFLSSSMFCQEKWIENSPVQLKRAKGHLSLKAPRTPGHFRPLFVNLIPLSCGMQMSWSPHRWARSPCDILEKSSLIRQAEIRYG